MKRTILPDLLVFLFLVFICSGTPFAQTFEEPATKQVNPFSFLTIIKLNEVATKDDMDKVRAVLRQFGYSIHSHKINFERKQVLVRMRQQVSNDTLISAFKEAGYNAWFDEKEKVHPADAAYKGSK